MSDVPRNIKALSGDQILLVEWTDVEERIGYVKLRGECACAHCVNEWTGERILDVDQIPADIVIERLELVGSYALRISWSDGHCSGLYTWERLRQVND